MTNMDGLLNFVYVTISFPASWCHDNFVLRATRPRRHQTVQETVEIEEKKLDSSDAYNLKKMLFFFNTVFWKCEQRTANSEQLKVKTVHFMAKPKADFSTELPESFWSVCAPKTIMY